MEEIVRKKAKKGKKTQKKGLHYKVLLVIILEIPR